MSPNPGPPDRRHDADMTGGGVRSSHTDRSPHTDESPTLSGDDTPVDLTGRTLGIPGTLPDGETVIGIPGALAEDPDGTQLVTAPDGTREGLTAVRDPGLTGGGTNTVVPGGPGEGPLAPGHAFGSRYHIVSVIGVGGMGAVYKAWDQELGVLVALKVIRPEVAADPEAAQSLERRFKQELLLARKVTHKNVVRIHDLGEVNGIKYITMPFIEGEDLADVLKREGRLPVQTVMPLARTIVSGMAAAHEAGIVHRDLKPANIMVDKSGEALIMDFGVARSAAPDAAAAAVPAGVQGIAASAHTVVGSVVGTVEYMAPEQARAQPVDQRADIYAIGLILYDLLLGRKRAEHAESAIAELTSRMKASPPPLRQVDPDIPEPLERIVTRCIQPDAAARFQTTGELVVELNRLDDEGKPLPVMRRLTGRMIGAAAVVVLLLVAGAFYVAQRLSAPPVQLAPVSVLIADFDNRSGDSTFEQSLEPALSIALEGASFITSFDRREARRVASQVGSPPKLDVSTARLVAIREGIKVVVTGNIQAAGGGYRISITGEDPSGKQLWSHYVTVSDKKAVLGGVAALASNVRSSLGDTASQRERLAAAEPLTAGSLDAVRNYSLGQDLHSSGKFEEAIEHYRKAVESDPNFGRAYAGWATSADHLGRKDEMTAQWKKALSLVDRMTEREKYRTLGTYYLAVAQNYEKAIENYSTLVRLYPTDQSGHNNLAYAHFKVLNFGKALEEGRKALEIYPKNVLFRNNYALYAMYAGDFATASREAQTLVKQEPGFYLNYLPVAVAATANGDFQSAERMYAQMAQTGAEGASLAAMGRADLAMYRGDYASAEAILKPAAAADEEAQNTGALAAKRIALAETYMAMRRVPLALETVKRAVQGATSESVLVPAARLYLQAGKIAEASDIAATLDNLLQTQTRAYAKIIDGNIALANNRRATAVDAFREAVKLADFWMARYDMGIAYVQATHYAEALGELEASQKRRGEATAIFLNDSPSFRYMAALLYWLARAQEGLGQRAAALANYKAYVTLRAPAAYDPLRDDASKRLTQ